MSEASLKKFQKRMRAIPKAARDAIKPSLLKGGYEIVDAMEALVPEDTGDLKGSIELTPPGQATPPYSQPGGSHSVPINQVAVTAGNTDVRYAHLVEYGTHRTAPKPFFWPGFRLARKKAENRIQREIRKAIREAK